MERFSTYFRDAYMSHVALELKRLDFERTKFCLSSQGRDNYRSKRDEELEKLN